MSDLPWSGATGAVALTMAVVVAVTAVVQEDTVGSMEAMGAMGAMEGAAMVDTGATAALRKGALAAAELWAARGYRTRSWSRPWSWRRADWGASAMLLHGMNDSKLFG